MPFFYFSLFLLILPFSVCFSDNGDGLSWDMGKTSLDKDGKKVISVVVDSSRADTVRAAMGYSYKDFQLFMTKVYCMTKCQDRLQVPKQKVSITYDAPANTCVCTLDEAVER